MKSIKEYMEGYKYIRCPFCNKGTMSFYPKTKKTGWFSSTIVIEVGGCLYCHKHLNFMTFSWRYDPHSQDDEDYEEE